MEIQCYNEYLEKVFRSQAVRGKPRYSAEVVLSFKNTILKLQMADSIRELHLLKGLNFEALKGDYKGYYSVRVDQKYRLILSIAQSAAIKIRDIVIVEDLTSHFS